MRRDTGSLTVAAFAAAALAAAAPETAFADDAAAEPAADRVWREMSGSIRAGWRFLADEDEGRFRQDRAVSEGPRLFDGEFRAETARDDAWLGFVEAEARGAGDDEQTYRLRAGRARTWDLSLGFDRDDYSYRATGDPYPYDTIRERSNLRLRVTPAEKLTLRLDWDRSVRKGDAWVESDTDIRENPPPAGVDVDLVQQHRPLDQRSDRVTLGADATLAGGFRASLAETWRLARIDDTRLYDVPASRRSVPVREALGRDVRTPGWTTTAKAGWRSAGGDLDVGAILSWTRQEVDADLSGTSEGYDPAFDPMGIAPRGQFSGATTGSVDGDRSQFDHRLEGTWRFAERWELATSAATESVTDQQSLLRSERRTYARTDVDPATLETTQEARVVLRTQRAAAEVAFEVSDELRLRAGQEYLRQNLRAPLETRGADFTPTDFSSTTWRTIAGADWEPCRHADLSLLAKLARDDDPHSATSFEERNEFTFRGRVRPSDALSLTAVWRHAGARQDTALDHATRSDAATLGATWTRDALAVSATVTRQVSDTRTDTTYISTAGGSFQVLDDQVSFVTRDLIASLDVRYAVAANLRAFATLSWVDSGGDYEARWDEASLGGEYDLRENLSVGLALRSWRLDEASRRVDDYSAAGAEVWVTWRF